MSLKHMAFGFAGTVLYPFMNGYMNAKYRKKLHVSRFDDKITLLYARIDATPVVVNVEDVKKVDQDTLGSWFHSTVADLNRGEVIPQRDKFDAAAKLAQELAHKGYAGTPNLVPRMILSPVAA